MGTKKKRTYNGRLFKSRRAYTLAEIAEKLNTHERTAQIWKREGLKVLDDNSKPCLAMGQDIRDFLKKKYQNRKRPLKTGEFFCPRCRVPRRSHPEKLTVEITARMLGKSQKQAFLRGSCEVCEQPLLLFSSDRKVEEWQKGGLILSQPLIVINGTENSSVNTDILKGQENG